MAHDGTGTGWDVTAPADADLIKDGAKEIRDVRKAFGIRQDKEHVTAAASSAGGAHLAGSAVSFYQATAPTTRLEGTSLAAEDNGRLFIDSDTDVLQHWNGSAFTDTLVNALTDTISRSIMPVGTIIGWHKSMTGVPSLPGLWLECNGQTISDTDSPMNTEVIPDLNDATNRSAAITAGGGVFLRGGDTSGVFADDTIQHHDHRIFERNNVTLGGSDNFAKANSTAATDASTKSIIDVNAPADLTAAGAARPGNETQPFNFTVVWIIRIK